MGIKDRWVSREALIKMLGEAGAARVVEVFGGRKTFLPAPGDPGFPRIVAKLGEEIAHKLCAEFGEASVTFPRQLVPFDEEIVKLNREMMTPTAIARRLGCSERYVYQVLSRQ